jgi:uncharacterized membrane protein YqjE
VAQNGQPKKSIVGEVLEMVEDQMELASLEWEYVKSRSARRIIALATAGLLSLSAFVFLQVALVQGLIALHLTLAQASLIVAGVYVAVAGALFAIFGRRDKRTGEPFQATREQIHKNLRWIRQLFS